MEGKPYRQRELEEALYGTFQGFKVQPISKPS